MSIEKIPMTTERFKELISQDQHKDIYESRKRIEGLCQLGVDLMNLVTEKDWELTHKFNKPYFALYFNGRIVFGVNLNGHPRLFVKLKETVIREHRHKLNAVHQYDKFDYLHGWAIYSKHVTVADIDGYVGACLCLARRLTLNNFRQ